MSISVNRRSDNLKSKKQLIEKHLFVEKSTEILQYTAEKKRKIILAREYYAASRINAIIRGFLGRLIYKEKIRIYRATLIIQKLMRGKLGRIKWMKAYWLSKSVVKSKTALIELVGRSKIVRSDGNEKGWKEMFDPITFGFWYYNDHYSLNTWSCPLVLQKELVCKWDGFQKYGGGGQQQRCRCVFDNMLEYQGHMTKAHKWYCPSCETKNIGLVFPECSVCGNIYSEDGENVVEIMSKHINDIDRHLEQFLTKDHAYRNPDYKLRDRLIQMTLAIRQDEEDTKLQEIELEKQKKLKKKNKNIVPAFTSKLTENELQTHMTSQSPESTKLLTFPNIHNKLDSANENNNSQLSSRKLKKLIKKSKKISTSRKIPQHELPDGSIPLLTKRVQEMPPLPEKDDPVLFGILPAATFDTIIEDRSYLPVTIEPETEEDLEEQRVNAITSLPSGIYDRLVVCKKYLNGQCTLTTCPHAHPHIRDEAKITHMRIPGMIRRVPFVEVCPLWLSGKCPNGNKCDLYHLYIRPSTAEIIKRIYPIQEGTGKKYFQSGATLEGKVKGSNFHGYGIMHWTSGASYLGDWKNSQRDGFGIYRTPEGLEYVGEWKEGKKDGWCALYYPNGEEYIGQFKEGQMHGIGILTSANGDIYEGQFEKHKYHGYGIFHKKNGDVYMGYCINGMADGLGILALFTGEKYKGYFSRNARHGKGVCAYPNGSRYAGQWYRGVHEGFGIYLGPIEKNSNGKREKYVGEWSASKKEGKGRYFFSNGDIYDGDFHNNLAKGLGIYIHTKEGNIYSGEWDNDMRNGRGTYNFSNGSKFTGNWVNNNIDGKGKFDFSCGSYYRGEFKKNLKHGKGIFVWPNGNTYKGTFIDDKMCGFGEMSYCTGHIYRGNWIDNKKNGFGIFKYVEGHIYEGNWVDDIRHGKGKMIYYTNTYLQEIYEGDWENDEKHGYGIYIYKESDGNIYEGDWLRNRRHGKGKLTFKDKSFYRGDFSNELMHGKGIHVSADGCQYEGEWFENERHGEGVFMGNDGNIYEGTFWHNRKQGNGVLEYLDGNKYNGVWEDGQIVGKGVVTLQCGKGSFGGPTQVKVKVFGF